MASRYWAAENQWLPMNVDLADAALQDHNLKDAVGDILGGNKDVGEWPATLSEIGNYDVSQSGEGLVGQRSSNVGIEQRTKCHLIRKLEAD